MPCQARIASILLSSRDRLNHHWRKIAIVIIFLITVITDISISTASAALSLTHPPPLNLKTQYNSFRVRGRPSLPSIRKPRPPQGPPLGHRHLQTPLVRSLRAPLPPPVGEQQTHEAVAAGDEFRATKAAERGNEQLRSQPGRPEPSALAVSSRPLAGGRWQMQEKEPKYYCGNEGAGNNEI